MPHSSSKHPQELALKPSSIVLPCAVQYGHYCTLRYYEISRFLEETMEGQVVLLLDHMPADVTQGYELYFSILLEVNGKAIHSMEDLLMSIVNCE